MSVDDRKSRRVTTRASDEGADVVRRLIDVVFCLLLAVLVVPMVVIALAIWAEDKQPTLFRRNEWGCVATGSPS